MSPFRIIKAKNSSTKQQLYRKHRTSDNQRTRSDLQIKRRSSLRRYFLNLWNFRSFYPKFLLREISGLREKL